ncbi:MAG: ral secretion pathway protein, partial [Aliidongia sp.]|nr:ral secretion pathway protein [Aliidongia sp.]
MVFRNKFLLAVSALALAACQQHPGATLASLPQAGDPNAGVATPRVSGAVGADARTQPEPEISLGTGGTGKAATLPPGKEVADVQLNFADTDIREIVRQVLGNILQVNYSIDPAVHGTATIETVKPLKRDELLPTLELLLNQNGASLVQSGSLYRVLPSATAVATPALANEHTTGSEIVTLHYASAKDLAKVLEPFVAEGAKITPDPNRNMLLISGEPAARRTLISLISGFDTDLLAGQSFALFPVTNGQPAKIATDLQKALLTEGDSALAGVVRVIPMDRANAVLVVSSQKRYIDAAQRLFRLMERARKDTERTWHVYYIQNGQANDVANILQRAFTPDSVTAKADSSSGGGSTAPGLGQSQIGGGSSGGFGGGSSGIG